MHGLFPWGPPSLLWKTDIEKMSLEETQHQLHGETTAFLGTRSKPGLQGAIHSAQQGLTCFPSLTFGEPSRDTDPHAPISRECSSFKHQAQTTDFLRKPFRCEVLHLLGLAIVILCGAAGHRTLCAVTQPYLNLTPHDELGTLGFRFFLQMWWNWGSERKPDQGGGSPAS